MSIGKFLWPAAGGIAVSLMFASASLAQDTAVITKQYEDGGIYEGTFKDGKQHGTGSYRLPNGYVYEGEWVEGEIRGIGRAVFTNGSIYDGEFQRGKPEGLERFFSQTAAPMKGPGSMAR